MPEYDKNKNNNFGKIDYIAVAGDELFSTRDHKNYSKVTLAENTLPHIAAPRLDGQALAGTGALVFEGEILTLS